MQPSTVLFLAANPMRVQPLQLGEECRTIENRIRAAKYRDRIRFRSRWAARPDDLLQALNEDAPSVLHFSGHGAGDQGLCFQSEDGGSLSVSAEGLEQVMQSAGTSVTVVVLNACFSEVQARALVSHVPCVIGMSDAIKDESAVIYAGAFYRALAFGKSVANAHRQGLAALAVQPTSGQVRDVEPAGNAPCAPVPTLLIRSDTDADLIHIVAAPITKTRCELVIKATLSDFDTDVIARVTELLREVTGDLSLEISNIKEGSVRLTISLSAEAAKKLMLLRANGQLNELCGFEVSALSESPEKREVMRPSRVPGDMGGDVNRGAVLPVARIIRPSIRAWKSITRREVSERRAGLIGALLGNYRVVEQLGQGGMGVVYIGRHERLGHRVVVKELRSELSRHTEMVQRFFNEAQAATAIRNPGIAQVFDFGTTPNGCTYFVMELLEGVSLSDRLKERQLDAVECCRLARQMANVLQAAHNAGITHRDLKPDNLFLVPDMEVVGGERVKVLDFGIAKLASGIHASGVQSRTDLVMGRPSYMSPEQCRGAGSVDNRSDIYALGCVLFEMVCGRAPFIGHSAVDIIGAQLDVPPPDVRDFAPDTPPALAALVGKMLERKPAARPQTMGAVSRVLDEILHELVGWPARPSPPLPMLPVTTSPASSLAAQLSTPTRSAVPPPMPAMASAWPAPSMAATEPTLAMESPLSAPATAATVPMPAMANAVALPSPPPQAAPPFMSSPVPQPMPSLVPLGWRQAAPPQGAQLSSSSTALGGSVGVSSTPPQASARWLPLVLGGLAIVGLMAAIAIALSTGDSRSAEPPDAVNATSTGPTWHPESHAGVDAAVATPPVVADASGEPVAPAETGSPDESDCRGFEVDRKWDELAKCADQLKATDPKRAEEMKARAAEEARTAPRIAAVEDAIRAKDLKRAQAELDQVWTESLDYTKIKRKYAAAENQAIAVLAAKLEYALSPSCWEYNALLTKQRDAQSPRVVTEAARQVTCTPLSPTRCDARALAEEGRQLHAVGRLVRALASYEASWTCSKDNQTATRGFLIACNIPSLYKAKMFWKRLPTAAKPSVTSCENNKITRQQLEAP